MGWDLCMEEMRGGGRLSSISSISSHCHHVLFISCHLHYHMGRRGVRKVWLPWFEQGTLR